MYLDAHCIYNHERRNEDRSSTNPSLQSYVRMPFLRILMGRLWVGSKIMVSFENVNDKFDQIGKLIQQNPPYHMAWISLHITFSDFSVSKQQSLIDDHHLCHQCLYLSMKRHGYSGWERPFQARTNNIVWAVNLKSAPFD